MSVSETINLDEGMRARFRDLVGNRTQEVLDDGSTVTTSVYGYPAGSNRLADVTQASSTVRGFTYDAAGNLIQDDRVGTPYQYAYNDRSRLKQFRIGGTIHANYRYDVFERIAWRQTLNMTPAGTTHYVQDLAGRLIAEATDTGTILREYVWVDDMPVAVFADLDTASPQLYYVHPDHLNRPLRMTDGAKTVVWDAVYKPFGEAHAISGSASLNLRFPGQYFLLEHGLAYDWHRYYDPTIGRYTRPDPMGFVDGPSVYAYAWSAPTQYADPMGLASSEYSEECRQLRSDIMSKYFKLMGELSKYNPQTDAIGGFPMAGGGVTKPGGHYQEIQNLQRGIKNDIARYNKLCRNDDDDGGGAYCPPVPRYVDQRANQYVPEPRYPDYGTSRRWQFDVPQFPGGPYSPWFPRRWGLPGIR